MGEDSQGSAYWKAWLVGEPSLETAQPDLSLVIGTLPWGVLLLCFGMFECVPERFMCWRLGPQGGSPGRWGGTFNR